jgi:hypothetical protein
MLLGAIETSAKDGRESIADCFIIPLMSAYDDNQKKQQQARAPIVINPAVTRPYK